MRERDLIVGVLAAQAGFVTPSEVLAAAAGGLVDSGPDSLLTRLEKSGALTAERRKALEALAEQALAARNGDARAVLTSMGAATGAIETLVSYVGASPVGKDGQPAAALEVPLERPGQYTRLQELGRGSQSVVRAARDEIVGREVALKELVALAEPGKDESSRAAQVRFLREVRLVAGLDHPGIVSILELARREDGTLFCAQKLIRGETLQVRLARCHSLADRLALLRHVLDACQAMGFAHAKHVIHRDLKPSNIMVGEYGETVVVDWGLAKHREEAEEVVPLIPSSPEPGLTVAGVALGTPAYMGPEQARGDLAAIDARSDVFSLGAILYQVLTGRPPFEGATSDHILENVRAGRFPPVRTLAPDAPAELAAIAERALRPESSERYRDAEEIAREISAYLAGGRVGAYQYGTWELLRKFAASHRALMAGLGVALGALLVSAVVVGIRLQVVRRDLARSFVERAHAAELESDWALAAAYFAAARTERDTPESRWGVALTAESAIERVLSLAGASGSFTDVGVLPDGRMIVLGAIGNRVEVRELDSGKTLWLRDSGPVILAALLPGGLLRLSVTEGWAFFDLATGRQLSMIRRETGEPCPTSSSTRVLILDGRLVARRDAGNPVTLATDVGTFQRCSVSEDGSQVAYEDASGKVRLLSVSDGRTLAEREVTGLRALLFSAHGLVIVRQGWLEVLAGGGRGFSVALPEAAFGSLTVRIGGIAVSPDGHLVVVARLGSSRADVVDLRTRVVRGTLHYSQGWPRFGFSLDSQRVFAAGLHGGSRLDAWRLPPDESPGGHQGKWQFWSANFSPSGRQMAIIDASRPELQVYDSRGALLSRSPIGVGVTSVDLVRDGVVYLIDWRTDQVTLRDVVHQRDLWNRVYRGVNWVQVSVEGSRVGLFGAEGLEVWDASTHRSLFSENARVGGLETVISLAPNGQRVAWTERTLIHLRDVDSGVEHALHLDAPATAIEFNPDSRRIAAITTASRSLWDASTGRPLWTVSHTTPDRPYVTHWSADATSLLIRYESLGTELIDGESGARLARFPPSGALGTVVSPDLRTKLVASESSWDLRPLPEPPSDSPSESLGRILHQTGLALEGVEIVAAP